jgi:hypothetical protein
LALGWLYRSKIGRDHPLYEHQNDSEAWLVMLLGLGAALPVAAVVMVISSAIALVATMKLTP